MKRRGSAMIEMAFAMILFSALVAGGFNVVRDMSTLHDVESAVRAGARAGGWYQRPDLDDPQFRATVVAAMIAASPRIRPADVVIETKPADGAVRDIRVSVHGYRASASYPWTGPVR